MAIAQIAQAQGSGNTGTLTVSITVPAHTDGYIVMNCAKDHTAISGITVNGVSATKQEVGGSGSECASGWVLANPGAGTYDIVVSFTPTPSLYLHASVYSGVKQTGQPHKETNNQVTGNLTLTVTTTTDNCWAVIGSKDQANGVTAGSGTTLRGTYNISTIADSNGPKTPAGSFSLVLNCPAGTHSGWMIALEPAPDATATYRRRALLGVGQ
jgi:hypothetical protein